MAKLRSAFVPHDLKAPLKGSLTGSLAGLTAAVKDMYDIAGERTGGGTPAWLEAHPPARKTGDAVQRILDAGATVIGKAVCDEYFFSVTGANAHYGTPINPRAPGRLPGGSSSGSASATASGACDFALGSDTGGSVRIPASFCGIYGLRPTWGRVSLNGVMAMAHSFDVPGWFASGPGVFANVGRVILEGERLGGDIDQMLVLDDAFTQADASIASLLSMSLTAMAGELPKPRHVRIAPDGLDPWREAFRTIQGRETWESFGPFIEKHKPEIGPGVRERIAFSSQVTQTEADEARKVHARAREHIRGMVPRGTILTLPTSPCIAPQIDLGASDLETVRVRIMRLTCIAGLSGLPQVSIPIGTVQSCPIGLSFIGWAGGDEALLNLAVKLSRFCGAAG